MYMSAGREGDGAAQLALNLWPRLRSTEVRSGGVPLSPRRALRCVGLFAGIGGIELGLARAGHPTLLMCEADSAASAVLKARFPGIPIHPDVRELNSLPRDVHLLCAGFP